MTDTAARTVPAWRMTLVVAVVALAVLAAIALRTRAGLSFLKYPIAAEMVLDGSLARERTIDFSPLYLGLHVAATRFVSAPRVAISAAQTVLAAASVALLFVILRRRVSRRLALVGAAGLLFNRNLLVHQSILEPEIVLLFLVLVFLAWVARPGRWTAFGAGVAGALALATRPNLLPVLALVPVAYCFARPIRSRLTHEPEPKNGDPGRWRGVIVPSALFGLPIALAVGLLMLRSAEATGNPLAPTMNPGTVFFEGNNPLSFGTSAVYPPVVSLLAQQPSASREPDRAHQLYRDIARASTGEPLSVSQVNGYWRDRALAFIRAEPLRWLRLELGKMTLAFHSTRLHDVATAWLIERELGLLPSIPFALVGALALVGLLVEAPRWRRALLLYALLASQLATMLVFYVSARQRIVLLPAALYFAMVALERLGQPHRRLYGLLAILLGLCLVLPHPVLDELAHQRSRRFEAEARVRELQAAILREPPAWHREAATAWLATRPDRVPRQRAAFLPNEDVSVDEQILRSVISRNDLSAPGRFDRAIAERAAGRLVEAEATLAELEAEGFTPYRSVMSTDLATHRAWLAALGGDASAAEGHVRRALERSPGDPHALALQVALWGDEAAKQDLDAFWSRADVELLLGQAFLDLGKPEQAYEHLAWIARAAPTLRVAEVDLAATLGALGRHDEGARHYLRQHARSVDPIDRDPEIANLFRAWLAADPQPQRRLLTARILHAFGYSSEALRILEPLEAALIDEAAPEQSAGDSSRLAREVQREAATIRRALSPGPQSLGRAIAPAGSVVP